MKREEKVKLSTVRTRKWLGLGFKVGLPGGSRPGLGLGQVGFWVVSPHKDRTPYPAVNGHAVPRVRVMEFLEKRVPAAQWSRKWCSTGVCVCGSLTYF